MYQVGRAERPDSNDERFIAQADAMEYAHTIALGDFVIAVWHWRDEDTADVVCLIYGGDVYHT